MIENSESKVGFIITVPEGNGYDQGLVRVRVLPHIQQVTKFTEVEIPSSQEIEVVDVNRDGSTYAEVTDKLFGIYAVSTGFGADELTRKFYFMKSLLQSHYGLRIEEALITNKEDGLMSFMRIIGSRE